MADDSGMLCNVIGNTDVILALDGGFVGGHADAVGDDFDENLSIFDGGEFKFL